MTPEGERRVAREIAQVQTRSREQHPERYAPDGSALILWPGRDWFERANAWRAANGQQLLERTTQLHYAPEPRPRPNTYSDERAP